VLSFLQLRLDGRGPQVAASERLLKQAKVAYAAEGVVGSDAKDQFSQRVFCAAGAQIDASPPTVSAGQVLVGLPAHRRLALAHASLTVAADRYISEELASILAGSWVTALLYRRCLMAAIGPLFGLGKRVSQLGGSSLRPLPPAARQDLVLLSVLAPALVSNVAAPGFVLSWYTRLAGSPALENDSDDEECDGSGCEPPPASPSRFAVGPVINARPSPFFQLSDPRCLEWILCLLQTRKAAKVCGAALAIMVVAGVVLQRGYQVLSAPGPPAPPASGLEGLLLNDVMVANAWQTDSAWAWRDKAHINVLEARAFLRALRLRALSCDDQRFVHGLDSHVALGAFLKGRTSSRMLLPAVKRAAALQVAFGLYPGPVFCPTRLNVSDAPTRDRSLPVPVPRSLLPIFKQDPYGLSALQGLSKSSSNWFPLALLLALPHDGSDGSSLLKALTPRFRDVFLPAALDGTSVLEPPRPQGFDSTKGYPGEGPPAPSTPGPFLLPRDAKDRTRARAREGAQLAEGRPVLECTSKNRASLLALFGAWLVECGTTLEDLLDSKKADAEVVNMWVVSYGRQLFESGRPYWHYAETINGLAARKPILKRTLQAAWDLAFSWMALEPTTHHVAMPAVILLSMLTVCLHWGWLREAGLFSLAWGGLLRIGEATAMLRRNLVLPQDVLFSQGHILARIEEPKTRMRMARHQAARVEQMDLVQLVALSFADLEPHEKLWPLSSQTLRRRFDLILERLGISTTRGKHRPLDLGSFRPGGATHLLSLTENSELVRRRGRWASHRVMEIYIQEVTACTFFPSLPLVTRQRVLLLAQAFTATLEQAAQWKR
ncbi:unnamed protein product, partial [Symbiodinium necroappetens]